MNISFLRPLALVAALSLGYIGSTAAAQYTSLDTHASRIAFGYSQMGVRMAGSFGELKATELRFDPADPASASITLEVALSSVDAGYDEANVELHKDEWLAIAQHPLATFTANKVEVLGDGSYRVSGDLSIKGHTRAVSIPFSFSEDGNKGIFEGSFILQRADFAVGDGQWKDFGIVANDIEIRFQLVATQSP